MSPPPTLPSALDKLLLQALGRSAWRHRLAWPSSAWPGGCLSPLSRPCSLLLFVLAPLPTVCALAPSFCLLVTAGVVGQGAWQPPTKLTTVSRPAAEVHVLFVCVRVCVWGGVFPHLSELRFSLFFNHDDPCSQASAVASAL